MGIVIAVVLFLGGLCLVMLGASLLSDRKPPNTREGELMTVEPQFRRQAAEFAAELGVALPAAGAPLEQYKGWFEEIGHRVQLRSFKKTREEQLKLAQQEVNLHKLWLEMLETHRKIANERAAMARDAEVATIEQETRLVEAKVRLAEAQKKLRELETPPASAFKRAAPISAEARIRTEFAGMIDTIAALARIRKELDAKHTNPELRDLIARLYEDKLQEIIEKRA